MLGVGGTDLTLTASNAWSSETGWSDSSGGPSVYESQPSYQTGVVTQQSTARAAPDVAYDADPNTGVAVYDSVPYEGTTYGWVEVGGTSEGAPQWSALVAIADQGRAAAGESALNTSSPQQVMTLLYENPGDFHDITSGSSAGKPKYSAGPGYDYVTGLGSPMANLVVGSLVGGSTTTPPTTYDKLVLSAPTAETAGKSFTLTITAENSSGATDTSFVGTVDLSSTDSQAVLPASVTFAAGNDGVATATITLKTAGSQSITATESGTPEVTGALSGITVSPAAASKLVISGLASTATAGTPDSFTVTAYDAYGNVATGYAGTVAITSSDPAATLPASFMYSSSSSDGTHVFSITFATAGTQSVTATDSADGFTVTQSGIAVAPAAPTSLTASAVSNTQIDLSWTGSSGATGYIIQDSTSSTTGFTQVGTTSSGSTTTFDVTGLTAGTTYYFRVIATLGSVDSGYSNVASATTTGTAPVADTMWGTAYPPENAYSSGSYEVGEKFTSSVAGEITGIRFYKQTWMSGEVNVGHLWSATGQLLAAATFTNETSYGWQQVNLSTPVTIAANTTYIVSFSTGGGYFGITTGYFTSGAVTNGPLTAESNSVAGGNGVYNYQGDFPDVDGNGMNFWADVAFSPTSSGNVKPGIDSGTSRSVGSRGFGFSALTEGTQSNQPVKFAVSVPVGPAGYYFGASRATVPVTQGTTAYGALVPQSVSSTGSNKDPFGRPGLWL